MKKSAAEFFLCLLLVSLTLLSGCGVPGSSADRTDSGTQESAGSLSWEDAGALIADGKTEFIIIRPDECSDYLKKQAGMVYSALSASCPEIQIKTDWEKNLEEKTEEIAQRYEILIGNTNRPQSAAAGLGSREYRVFRDGRKLVLAGGSDRAVGEAVNVLLASLRTEDHSVFFDAELTGKTTDSYLIAVTDQKNSRIEVFDLADGDLSSKAALWSHKYAEYNIADTRLREYNGKEVVLAAFGGTSASMVDYETGTSLWFTNQTANNPHAAELIPAGGGVIAVAASTGGEIRFFALPSSAPSVSVPLEDAHGVLWDPTLNVLWAQGGSTLCAYTVVREGGTVTVTEVPAYRTSLPSGGAHDLQPFYGDTDKLLITNSKAVYVFSKSEKKFDTGYDGSRWLNRSGVKGVGIFDDGSFVSITPDGAFKTWTSATVSFLQRIGDSYAASSITSPDGGFYKVRVWNKNYQ